MKLHLIHDSAGRILAAIQLDAAGGVGPIPVAGAHQHALFMDLPSQHDGKSLHEICIGHRVDVNAKVLVEGST